MAKAKQPHLTGMEPPRIPAIEKLADDYASLRDQRMQLLREETDKGDLLWAKMKEHKLQRYELSDGRTVEVTNVEKVKVRKAKPEGDDE